METFQFDRGDTVLTAYLWKSPQEKAVLQIVHGAGEHARRYREMAQWLADRGITVYSFDNRGHGLSQKEGEEKVIIPMEDGAKLPGDVVALGEYIKEYHDGKLFLLGHSMGSFIARAAATMTDIYDGFFFLGSGRTPAAMLLFGKRLVKILARRNGPNAISDRLDDMTFNSMKRELIKKGITEFEEQWLTSDPTKVLEIQSDPYMVQRFTLGAYNALYTVVQQAQDTKAMEKIRADAPIYFLSGANDPLGGYGKKIGELVQLYKKHSPSRVISDLYPGMNHEIHNEEEREDVYADILGLIRRELV